MIQCFAKKNFTPTFKSQTSPSLLYVSKTGEDESAQSRIMHSHDDYLEIILICSGSGEYLIDGEKRKVTKGDLVVYNSNVVHDEASNPDVPILRYCCAIGNVSVQSLRDNALIADSDSPVFACGTRFEAFEHIFEALFALLSEGSAVAEEAGHYLLQALLALTWDQIHAEQEVVESGIEDVNVLGERIKRHIDRNFSQDITLQTISEALNISPYYLSHVFKRKTGFAPLQYILRRRIGEAQTLLISTDYSITTIAAMVGYNNSSHFNALFTKNVGMSARKYRTNYIASEKKRP